MFIYFWERQRQRQSVNGRGRERGRHRIWIGSRIWAVSTEPNAGLKSTKREIMSRSQTLNQLSHPGTSGQECLWGRQWYDKTEQGNGVFPWVEDCSEDQAQGQALHTLCHFSLIFITNTVWSHMRVNQTETSNETVSPNVTSLEGGGVEESIPHDSDASQRVSEG